jgi:DNA repair protein RecO (recombination protein O)
VRALPAAPAGTQARENLGRVGRGGELRELAGLVEAHELLVPADAPAVDYDLGERHHARHADELRATLRILGEVDLLVADAALGKEGLGDAAVAAGLGRIHGDLTHGFRKYSAIAGSIKTEGIVLRSLRYGEADRILHLYTPTRGRISAIAKGVRKAKSRFGGRLEPFFRLDLVLYEGRSELLTVTSAETVAAHPRLREHAGALDGAARACEAVARIFDDGDPHTGVYHLLANELALLDRDPARAGQANSLAFRLKLLLAAGFAPQLAGCASCGEAEHLVGFSGAAGGVVCAACEASAFPLDEEAHTFMVAALGRPLAEAPDAPPRALAQTERAIIDTHEHHANLRLRPVGNR